MSAFREMVPQAHDIRTAAEEDTRPAPLDEMAQLAGLFEAPWGYTAIPQGGPTGPQGLAGSPRPSSPYAKAPLAASPRPGEVSISVVATDAENGMDPRRARRWRRDLTRQMADEQDKAVFQDPRVRQALQGVADLTRDVEHLLQQQQARMDGIALQMARLLQQAARSPEELQQLRQHLPRLFDMVQSIRNGEPAKSLQQETEAALAELDYAGVRSPTVAATFTF